MEKKDLGQERVLDKKELGYLGISGIMKEEKVKTGGDGSQRFQYPEIIVSAIKMEIKIRFGSKDGYFLAYFLFFLSH